MRVFLLCFSFIFFILSETFAQRKVSFVEEYIDFEINPKSFVINGAYLLHNNTDQEVIQKIIFPFGMSTDSITVSRVWDLANGHSIDYEILKESIVFSVKLSPKDFFCFNIMYDQPIRKENRYILRSTQAWGEALKVAIYSLSVKSFDIDRFSYIPDSVKENTYYWKKKDFLPEKDFIVILK